MVGFLPAVGESPEPSGLKSGSRLARPRDGSPPQTESIRFVHLLLLVRGSHVEPAEAFVTMAPRGCSELA